jgi:hypothetical protein
LILKKRFLDESSIFNISSSLLIASFHCGHSLNIP